MNTLKYLRSLNNSQIVVLSFGLMVLIAIPFLHWRHIKDPKFIRVMDKHIFNPKITGWRISHFLLHLVMGIIFPTKLFLFMGMGIAWEITETILVKITKDSRWVMNWEQAMLDIIANTLGFLTGMYIANCIDSNPSIEK